MPIKNIILRMFAFTCLLQSVINAMDLPDIAKNEHAIITLSHDQQTHDQQEQRECVICFTKIEQTHGNRPAPALWLACNHSERFHAACLHRALQHNKQCPLCRASTTTSESIQHSFDVRFESIVKAAFVGNIDAVAFFLAENPTNIHTKNAIGQTALMVAAHNNHIEVVQLLIDHDAHINDHSDLGSITTLMFAAYSGNTAIVKFLLDHDAHINDCDRNSNTSLIFAAKNGHTETVQLLLKNGAQLNDHNNNGESPFTAAVEEGHVATVQLLLDNGAPINSDDYDVSPLMLALSGGHINMIQFLRSRGAPWDIKKFLSYPYRKYPACNAFMLSYTCVIVLFALGGLCCNN